jgi:hypothetical protein
MLAANFISFADLAEFGALSEVLGEVWLTELFGAGLLN